LTAIAVAANRGDIGGGELMQLRLAAVLSESGYDVTMVAPSTPDDLAVEARGRGLEVEVVPCRDRRSYARALRRWDAGRHDVLWCHGLLPALATAGRRHRVVHLHQLPRNAAQRAAARTARLGSDAVVVPSVFLQERLGGDVDVLPNWTDEIALRPPRPQGPVTIGFLGRIGTGKGVDVLGRAVALLDPDTRTGLELLVAGDDRFVPDVERATVQTALAAAGVPVRRPGWIDRDGFFACVDVAVVPSAAPESFGLVAAEAMAAGVPVVVSDAGALPEVVGPAHPWVARAGDAGSLAEALRSAVGALPAVDVVAQQRTRWERHYAPGSGRESVARLLERWGWGGSR
jgi:glycosyltransferase involved in cell wall biosynthesis